MSEVREAIIPRALDGHPVGQRAGDMYVNATELCRAAGKQLGHYRENQSTVEFLTELSGSIGIPMDLLVQSITHGPNDLRGTWVHPDVAVNLAQWCSPKFAVQVSRWVRDLLTRGHVSVAGADDPEEASLLALRDSIASIIQLRRRQAELRREQEATRRLAATAQRTAAAALAQAENNFGYFQVLGFARLAGMELTERQAAMHGRAIAKLCRSRGVEIRDQKHERYGTVHLYPESVLRQYFEVPTDDQHPVDGLVADGL